MGDKTSIEWTRGDDGSPGATWNPATGCTKVSPGCDLCYAETFAERWRGTPGHYFERGFDVELRPDKLGLPLRWRRPRRIFVNSMSDLYHASIDDDFVIDVFVIMAMAPQHTFMSLTKRHARQRALLNSESFRDEIQARLEIIKHPEPVALQWPLPNLWVGASAEDQHWADIRIPALLETPAAVRWISAEPLLGPIDLTHMDVERNASDMYWINALTGRNTDMGRPCHNVPTLDWIVAGGESGRGARRMDPDWARSLRDQCAAANVAFMFKQAGSVLAREWGAKGKGGDPDGWPEPFPRQYPDAS